MYVNMSWITVSCQSSIILNFVLDDPNGNVTIDASGDTANRRSSSLRTLPSSDVQDFFAVRVSFFFS